MSQTRGSPPGSPRGNSFSPLFLNAAHSATTLEKNIISREDSAHRPNHSEAEAFSTYTLAQQQHQHKTKSYTPCQIKTSHSFNASTAEYDSPTTINSQSSTGIHRQPLSPSPQSLLRTQTLQYNDIALLTRHPHLRKRVQQHELWYEAKQNLKPDIIDDVRDEFKKAVLGHLRDEAREELVAEYGEMWKGEVIGQMLQSGVRHIDEEMDSDGGQREENGRTDENAIEGNGGHNCDNGDNNLKARGNEAPGRGSTSIVKRRNWAFRIVFVGLVGVSSMAWAWVRFGRAG